jgi:hypothetical protein
MWARLFRDEIEDVISNERSVFKEFKENDLNMKNVD